MITDAGAEIAFYRSLRTTSTNEEALQAISEESRYSREIPYDIKELEQAIRAAGAWIPDGEFSAAPEEPPPPFWISAIPGCMWIALASIVIILVLGALGVGASDNRSPIERGADGVCRIVKCT